MNSDETATGDDLAEYLDRADRMRADTAESARFAMREAADAPDFLKLEFAARHRADSRRSDRGVSASGEDVPRHRHARNRESKARRSFGAVESMDAAIESDLHLKADLLEWAGLTT